MSVRVLSLRRATVQYNDDDHNNNKYVRIYCRLRSEEYNMIRCGHYNNNMYKYKNHNTFTDTRAAREETR